MSCHACGNYLTFCRSPLDTAFYYGRVEIVRMVLAAGAELDYINCRGWTCARYIYVPQLSNLRTMELLEICASQHFNKWGLSRCIRVDYLPSSCCIWTWQRHQETTELRSIIKCLCPQLELASDTLRCLLWE